MYCKKCGSSIDDNMSYCPKCGNKLLSPAEYNMPTQPLPPQNKINPQKNDPVKNYITDLPNNSNSGRKQNNKCVKRYILITLFIVFMAIISAFGWLFLTESGAYRIASYYADNERYYDAWNKLNGLESEKARTKKDYYSMMHGINCLLGKEEELLALEISLREIKSIADSLIPDEYYSDKTNEISYSPTDYIDYLRNNIKLNVRYLKRDEIKNVLLVKDSSCKFMDDYDATERFMNYINLAFEAYNELDELKNGKSYILDDEYNQFLDYLSYADNAMEIYHKYCPQKTYVGYEDLYSTIKWMVNDFENTITDENRYKEYHFTKLKYNNNKYTKDEIFDDFISEKEEYFLINEFSENTSKYSDGELSYLKNGKENNINTGRAVKTEQTTEQTTENHKITSEEPKYKKEDIVLNPENNIPMDYDFSLSSELEDLINNYCQNLPNAVNSNNYSYIEPYIASGSNLEKMQTKLVEKLYGEGTTETFNSVEIADHAYDGAYVCYIYSKENYTIHYSNGKDITNDYKWKYTAKKIDGVWYLTNLEAY